jgi:hypothetical protein
MGEPLVSTAWKVFVPDKGSLKSSTGKEEVDCSSGGASMLPLEGGEVDTATTASKLPSYTE